MSISRDKNGEIIYDGSYDVPNDPTITKEELTMMLHKRKDYLIGQIDDWTDEKKRKEYVGTYNYITDDSIRNLVAESGSMLTALVLICMALAAAVIYWLMSIKCSMIIAGIIGLLITVCIPVHLDTKIVKQRKEQVGDSWRKSTMFESKMIKFSSRIARRHIHYYIQFYDENGKRRKNEIPECEWKAMKNLHKGDPVIVLKYPIWNGNGWKYMAFDPSRLYNKSRIGSYGRF